MAQNCSCHGSGDKYSQTVAAVLQRPRYSPGLILEDSDLSLAVDYTRSLSRLLFRNLLGCGVICGLTVDVELECGLEVTIAPGLGLDGCGDPIEVPRPITISIDRTELEKIESGHRPDKPAQFWVVLCGREKLCAPRALVCDADDFDGVTQPTRIQALAEASLVFERPECVCGCQRPPAQTTAAPPRMLAQNAATGANPHAGTAEPADDEVDCHHDHKYRLECAPDCGCGTACACACCLLLAHVSMVKAGDWAVRMRGVRRLIRLAMGPDPANRPENWTDTPQTSNVWWGEMEDRDRQEAMQAVYGRLEIGQPVTSNMVARMAEYWKGRETRRAEEAERIRVAEAEKAKAEEAEKARAAEAGRTRAAPAKGTAAKPDEQ